MKCPLYPTAQSRWVFGAFHKLIPDTGIFVSGLYTGRVEMHVSSNISTFLALGEEPAAVEFKETLFQRIADAKK